jgi:hypothetical protein
VVNLPLPQPPEQPSRNISHYSETLYCVRKVAIMPRMVNKRESVEPRNTEPILTVARKPVSKLVSARAAIPNSAQEYIFDHLLGVSTREVVITRDSFLVADRNNCPYSSSQWLPVNVR